MGVRPIRTLLVANRGEIARRIMRTASAMGIRTVAVHSDVDAADPHVAAADEAVRLGGRTAADSYLDVARIIDAARRTGADAVHPGYGFGSENPEFAAAVIDAGLTWVGPSPEAIAAMGDKQAAKRTMAAAGVPVLEAVELDDRTDPREVLERVGLPLVVKAAAGGGGKGMRVVTDAAGLADAVAAARREAAAAFGDPTVFAERYLTGARHVEVQVIGDMTGTIVGCFERECSIQRRHQKIIEEAPSVAVDPDLRRRMVDTAVAAASAIGYTNAGTVEMLLDDTGSFWFLEMNTRLQVEHPVTEAVCGIDLVREQLRVAEGRPLSFGPGDLTIDGHAIEARLYAEDPAAGFLPATGTVEVWAPAEEVGIRIDSGIEPGTTVGIAFDPLLAKVIAWAPTRAEAAARLARALERTRIGGVATNRDFLVAVLRSEPFLAGDTTCDFIDRHRPPRRRTPAPGEVAEAATVAALCAMHARRATARVLRTLPAGWRNTPMPPERVTYTHDDRRLEVAYRTARDGTVTVAVDDGEPRVVTVHALGSDGAAIEVDGRRRRWWAHRSGDRWWLHGPDGAVELTEQPRFPEPEAETVLGGLLAPMPGVVLAVEVAEGDVVAAGQRLVILEAMKMEHPVVAPTDGTVTEVRVRPGQQVNNGDLLVVVTPADDADAGPAPPVATGAPPPGSGRPDREDQP